MNFHDLSALHFSQNKRNMTYECIPELVVTVPAGCSSLVKIICTLTAHIHYRISQCSCKNFTILCVTFPWLSRPSGHPDKTTTSHEHHTFLKKCGKVVVSVWCELVWRNVVACGPADCTHRTVKLLLQPTETTSTAQTDLLSSPHCHATCYQMDLLLKLTCTFFTHDPLTVTHNYGNTQQLIGWTKHWLTGHYIKVPVSPW